MTATGAIAPTGWMSNARDGPTDAASPSATRRRTGQVLVPCAAWASEVPLALELPARPQRSQSMRTTAETRRANVSRFASLACNLFCRPREETPGARKREARTPAGRPASPGRTLSLRADPHGAPSDMLPDHRLRQVAIAHALAPASARIPLLCGMAPLMPRRNIALRALALRRLPGA